jgi:hypothetical protein
MTDKPTRQVVYVTARDSIVENVEVQERATRMIGGAEHIRYLDSYRELHYINGIAIFVDHAHTVTMMSGEELMQRLLGASEK